MEKKFNIADSEQVPFDIRLFNASTFIAAVFGIITILINLINQYPPVFSISVCITAVSFAVFYYLSRFRGITNILTNAIKFSDNNAKIMIVCDNMTGTHFLKTSIIDSGPGIEPGKLKYVFDKFAQIHSQKSGALRSTGLGLAFCKMVIEAHECAIGVDSTPDQLTTFWFTLKRADIQDTRQKIDNLHLTEKTKISLSNGDIEYLRPHLRKIAGLKYYESGRLVPLISAVDGHFSEHISTWKSEMEHAIYSNNESRFLELTRML